MDIEPEVKTGRISVLTFKLGDELFAANVNYVLNILEMSKITKIPNAPSCLKGIINLRGDVLPVLDTRLMFGMEETLFTTNTCILVLNIQVADVLIRIGALVDSVQEVLDIDEKHIIEPPTLGSTFKSNYLLGVVEHKNNFIMILDIEQVFASDDFYDVKERINQSTTKEHI